MLHVLISFYIGVGLCSADVIYLEHGTVSHVGLQTQILTEIF